MLLDGIGLKIWWGWSWNRNLKENSHMRQDKNANEFHWKCSLKRRNRFAFEKKNKFTSLREKLVQGQEIKCVPYIQHCLLSQGLGYARNPIPYVAYTHLERDLLNHSLLNYRDSMYYLSQEIYMSKEDGIYPRYTQNL